MEFFGASRQRDKHRAELLHDRRALASAHRFSVALVSSWWVTSVVRLGSGSVSLAYLVDPASSHMLVSKVKPCMPKFPLD